jgi:hypothetical protein
MIYRRTGTVCALLLLICLPARYGQAQTIGNHKAVFDANGLLRPWTSWRDALNREMTWYSKCPREHGYPRFVTLTFMDGDYKPVARRTDMIPAMQHGMGILSYLKYYAWTQRKDRWVLDAARAMGDYLIHEAVTPDTGKYPLFFRSTGRALTFPQPPDCGCQDDHPYEVQPDKGGIAGYALVLLTEETKDERYLQAALRAARTLAANMGTGDATHSPWPFRVDYRTGVGRGDVGANQSYTLRLFDKLIEHGYSEFAAPRAALWHWIKTFQIPSAARDGKLWVQFFEDYDLVTNRNSWSADNLARYLLEKKETIDPDWREDTRTLIDFVTETFTSVRNGIPVCGEQDDDRDPWGGACSNYGAVLAMYSAATGEKTYKMLAYEALNFCLYAIDNDGCPGQSAITPRRGGWQEDAHTDVVHNFMDAIAAFPEWGK